jgi:ElaB/YqjD/DUF883 family membrane-anchored ribosome-binding protein
LPESALRNLGGGDRVGAREAKRSMPMSKLSDAAKETVQDAREAILESGKAASAASGDIQADLQALRDDVARLARQIADIFAAQGGKTWRRARASVDEALADAEDRGQDAVDAVREVGDNMAEAIDKSLRERPYTTLALALGLGFLFGATWRR